MYVHVLSWLWTSCDTSMYSKRVNVHIMCTNADRSSKERQYHQSWTHRHVTDVYEDLGSCWILVDTGIEWYTMQTELWDICRIENNVWREPSGVCWRFPYHSFTMCLQSPYHLLIISLLVATCAKVITRCEGSCFTVAGGIQSCIIEHTNVCARYAFA